MSKIDNIINGWSNYLFDEVKANDDVILFRAKKCINCKHHTKGKFEAVLPDYAIREIQGFYCGKCKCPTSTKIRSENENCPIGKW